MSRLRFLMLVISLGSFTACGTSNKETNKQQPAAPQPSSVQQTPEPAAPEAPAPVSAPEAVKSAALPAPAPVPEPKAAVRKKSQPVQPVPTIPDREPPEVSVVPPQAAALATPPRELEVPQAPKPPEPKFFAVPAGTVIDVRLQQRLDSGVNKTGDAFSAILDKDIAVNGKTVAPRGSVLEGRLSQVSRSGRLEGRASMTLQLVSMDLDGQTYPIQTEILSFEAESTAKKDATKVGVGAGLGAVIGAIAGGGKGAAIGAAVGAGAGGATVAATRGKEVQMEREQQLKFALSRELVVKVQ